MSRIHVCSMLSAALLATACSGGSNPDGSGSSSGVPATGSTPAAPSQLAGQVVGRGAHLTWMDNSNNETVFVLERKAQGGTYGEVTRTPADTPVFHDAPLEPGIYVYRVSANGAAGRSAASNEATVTVPQAMSASSSSGPQVGSSAPGSGGQSSSTASLGSSAGTSSAASQAASSSGATATSGGALSGTSSSAAGPSSAAGGSSVASSSMASTSAPVAASSSSNTASSSGPAPVRPNFEDDIVPIFNASCGAGTNGCHSKEAYYATANRNCRGWLSLEDRLLGAQGYDPGTLGQATGCQDRDLYYRVTSINAWQCDVPYIAPGDPAGSYLYRKISGGPYCELSPGTPSDPMPVGSTLPAQDITTIRNWILLGAPRRQ